MTLSMYIQAYGGALSFQNDGPSGPVGWDRVDVNGAGWQKFDSRARRNGQISMLWGAALSPRITAQGWANIFSPWLSPAPTLFGSDSGTARHTYDRTNWGKKTKNSTFLFQSFLEKGFYPLYQLISVGHTDQHLYQICTYYWQNHYISLVEYFANS